jgi:hypothetical protein
MTNSIFCQIISLLTARSRRIWLWISSNTNGITAVITAVAALAAVYGLFLTKQTIQESTKLAWRNFLDEKGKDIGAQLVNENSPQSCIYGHGNAILDAKCEDILFKDASSVLMAYHYIEQVLYHLREVRVYDDENADTYFRWYDGFLEGLSYDPLGIVSYVLYDSFGCVDAGCYSCWHMSSSIEGANLACAVNLRVRFEADQENSVACMAARPSSDACISNLLRNRKKFIQRLEVHSASWKLANEP